MRTLPVLVFMSIAAMGANKVIVHGHRGARAVLPENTLPAFEYAIKAGVDVVELDLAVTRDDVLVVSHDATINPVICTGVAGKTPIRTLTLEQLRRVDCGSLKNPLYPKQKPVPGAGIPTLDQVLALADKGKFEFNIEMKSSPQYQELSPAPEVFAKLLYDAIQQHGLGNRVIVQSFDFRTLHAMNKLDPALRLSALYEGEAKSFVEIAKESGAKIVSPNYKLVTKQQVEAAHEAGLQVVAWTANKPEDWQRLIEYGVDGIISDDPAELISFLGRSPSR